MMNHRSFRKKLLLPSSLLQAVLVGGQNLKEEPSLDEAT